MPELTIIIPTLNEAENVQPLLAKLVTALGGVEWEALFVDDDSTDGTADLVRKLSFEDPRRVRVLQRIGRRGLSSACIEGMLASASPYMAVIDGDMQHDESLLARMLHEIRSGEVDLVIGSRNLAPGGMGEFAAERKMLSNIGTWMSKVVCRCHISDPMSGFFMLTRSFFMEVAHGLSGTGFKILVDLVASSKRPVRLKELPYVFRNRMHGASKLDLSVAFEYLLLLADKVFGQWVPARYVLFGIVGLSGALLHVCFLWIGLHLLHLPFSNALTTAISVVMVLNFFGNNQFTYHDRRLSGSKLFLGLISFCIACSIGAFSNYRLVETLQQFGVPIYLAAFCGALVGSVWNYAITAIFTWRSRYRARA